jgi:hypothetical protein
MKLDKITKRLPYLLVSFTVLVMLSALTAEYADAARGGRGGGAKRSGPASSGSVRGGHSSNRQDRTSNRRDNKQDRTSNRRDNKQDRNQNRRETRSDVRGERHERHEDRFRRHRARHITRAAFRGLSCHSTVVVVGSVSYYSCGGTYYERVYQGSEVVYIVVTDPT